MPSLLARDLYREMRRSGKDGGSFVETRKAMAEKIAGTCVLNAAALDSQQRKKIWGQEAGVRGIFCCRHAMI
jgi:hypothetical protein